MKKIIVLLFVNLFFSFVLMSQIDTMGFVKMSYAKPLYQKNGFVEYISTGGIETDSSEMIKTKTWFVSNIKTKQIERICSENEILNHNNKTLTLTIFDGKQHLFINKTIKASYSHSYKNHSKEELAEKKQNLRSGYLPSFMSCGREIKEGVKEFYDWLKSGNVQLYFLPDTIINGMNCFGAVIIDTSCHVGFYSENSIPGKELFSIRSEDKTYYNKKDSVLIYRKLDIIYPKPCPVLTQFEQILNYSFNNPKNENSQIYTIKTDSLKEYFLTFQQKMNKQTVSTVRNIPFTKAPNIHGITYTGDTFNLYNVKAKMILLDFWARFCAPCLRQMKDFKTQYQELKDMGLETIGINSDDIPSDKMNLFLDKKKFAHPLVYSKSAGNMYRVISIPLYFLLDENYMIIESFYRLDKEKINEIKKRLNQLSKQK